MRLFIITPIITPHPVSLSPSKGEREEIFKKSSAPLNFPCLFQKCLREATPLFLILPPSLTKGRGQGG